MASSAGSEKSAEAEVDQNDWPLWVRIGVPMLSIALFIAVNLYLYLTHTPPSEQEDLPLAGISATAARSQVPDSANYGSTAKDQTVDKDRLVPADNLALTISMEETSFNAAIQEPIPGTSASTLTAHVHTHADYSACAGACASKSTEPLVTSSLSYPARKQREMP